VKAILALDTSTRTASIAIYRGEEGVISEITWRSLSHHTVELTPYLDLLLGQNPRELAGIAVALGPGSFTGLRVGLSLAKGFALAQEIPLIGIPTLDALA
jgi:tRNA threonylcarbamoyladenosine biosynthesis protein TsaB